MGELPDMLPPECRNCPVAREGQTLLDEPASSAEVKRLVGSAIAKCTGYDSRKTADYGIAGCGIDPSLEDHSKFVWGGNEQYRAIKALENEIRRRRM